MPLSFPLSYEDFLGVLPISSMTMECPEVVETSQTAGAELLADAIGNRYWQGEIRLGVMQRSEARAVKALIDGVRTAGGSFMVHDITHPFPEEDPNGTVLAGLTPQISALPADQRLMRLNGVEDYTLRRGDYLGFEYLSSPTRFALHRVMDLEVTGGPIGVTPEFEVVPHIEPGAVTGAAVQLGRPACKAIIVPDSVQQGRTTRFITEGMSFSFIQTLR